MSDKRKAKIRYFTVALPETFMEDDDNGDFSFKYEIFNYTDFESVKKNV